METTVDFIPDFALDDEDGGSIEDLVNTALQTRQDDEWEKTKKHQRGIIVDIDGTLADVRMGLRRNPQEKFDLEKFYSLIPQYPCNDWCVRLVQIYYQMGFVIHIVTGRPERFKEQTEDWFAKYHIPYDFLYMRKDDDKRTGAVLKQEILDTEFPDKSLIEFAVEDMGEVVSMWRDNGITCLQPNNYDFIS